MAGQLLVEQGHEVVLHSRNRGRAEATHTSLPEAKDIVVGDLSTIAGTRSVTEQVNKLGRFDAVIHNAGVGYRESRIATADGLPHVFAINTLAPYLLTALIEQPKRLVYLSSGMHRSAEANLHDLTWEKRSWAGAQAYAESKLHDVLLAFAIARRCPWCSRMRWSLDGWQPGWAGPEHPTTWIRVTGPRPGLPSATTWRRASPANISITCESARRSPRSAMRRCRRN
jgi:NAD(P)-dependent dehydrogenase (short-subunit alcohol dehydrogenase family)